MTATPSNAGSVDIQPSSSKVTRLTKTIPNLQPGVTYTVLVRANKNGQYSDYASKTFTTPNADKSGNNFTVSNTNTDIQLLGGGFAASSTAHPFPINIGKIDITQNTIAGSGTGVIMNQYGIAGFQNGTKKFSLSASSGDSYFSGTISGGTINGTYITGGYGSFTGSITASSGYIANFTINTDTLVSTHNILDQNQQLVSTNTIGIYNATQALLNYSGGIKIKNDAAYRRTSYLVEQGLIIYPTLYDEDNYHFSMYSNMHWALRDSTDGYYSNTGNGFEVYSDLVRLSLNNYAYRLLVNNQASGIIITRDQNESDNDGRYYTKVSNDKSKLAQFALRNIYIQSGTFSAQSGADKGDIILVY